MSDTKRFPAVRLLTALGLGSAAAGGCLAGFGWLVVSRSLTQEAAGPLSAAAVCLGSLLSGLLMTMFQKEKGLLWGAAEGALFAGMLFLLGTLYQSDWGAAQFIRAGLAFLAGILGGVLGTVQAGRKRH